VKPLKTIKSLEHVYPFLEKTWKDIIEDPRYSIIDEGVSDGSFDGMSIIEIGKVVELRLKKKQEAICQKKRN